MSFLYRQARQHHVDATVKAHHMEMQLLSRTRKTLCFKSLPAEVSEIMVIAGESNLKIRRPVDIQADIPSSAVEARKLLGILSCEPPNSDLHNFVGNFAYQPKAGTAELHFQG